MNSLRIGRHRRAGRSQGIGAAEGFLHLFEGWVVFVLCLALLLAEAALLLKLRGPPLRLRDAFALDWRRGRGVGSGASVAGLGARRRDSGPLLAAVALLAVALAGSSFVAGRAELLPERQNSCCSRCGSANGRGPKRRSISSVLGALKLDDYLNADYLGDHSGKTVNFYVAYYASQRKGASAHSPRSCIPGGGWEIESSIGRSCSTSPVPTAMP